MAESTGIAIRTHPSPHKRTTPGFASPKKSPHHRALSMSTPLEEEPSPDVYYSMLVHNVSHWNLLVAFRSKDGKKQAIGRIKFNDVRDVSTLILSHLTTKLNRKDIAEIIKADTPISSSSSSSVPQPSPPSCNNINNNNSNSSSSSTSSTKRSAEQANLDGSSSGVDDTKAATTEAEAIAARNRNVLRGERQFNQLKFGFRFDTEEEWLELPAEYWSRFHVKQKQNDLIDRTEPCIVTGAYFPQIGVILPKWLAIDQALQQNRMMREAADAETAICHHEVYLISGCGTPSDDSQDASGNDTSIIADLIGLYISINYEHCKYSVVHSPAEIFQMDANVHFVTTHLKPLMEEKRRALAHQYGEDWSKHLHLVTSLTDGASARVHAISVGLRNFSPDCLHMWSLKRFWREFPDISYERCSSDVSFHNFNKLEMNPAVPVNLLDAEIQLLVSEMVAHKRNFEIVLRNGAHELGQFWHRKSGQPVLSVLMTARNHNLKFYRGVNMEVSLPTGSLCSERAAIGSALSENPGLTRMDFKAIAVMILNYEEHPAQSAANPAKRRKGDVEGSLNSNGFPPPAVLRMSSSSSSTSETPLPTQSNLQQLWNRQDSITTRVLGEQFPKERGDKNPIKPCGACTEWLKKIAQVNPDFNIVTFPTDQCTEAYVQTVCEL